MTDTAIPPGSDRPAGTPTGSLRDETDQFKREYLQLARTFGQIDIQLAGEFAAIVTTLRTTIQENPQLILRRGGATSAEIGGQPSAEELALAAKLDLDWDFIKSIIEKIVEFFLGDKEFILRVLRLILCGCEDSARIAPPGGSQTGQPTT